MRERLAFAQELQHPNLSKDGYRVTSQRDKRYNCAAWAAGEENTEKWWEPRKGKGYHWPNEAPFNIRLGSYVKAYESVGFSECDDGEPETGFEKIVLYQDADGDFSHAARQLESGKWTSKLGPQEDIEHTTAKGAEGGIYGRVAKFLKRRRL